MIQISQEEWDHYRGGLLAVELMLTGVLAKLASTSPSAREAIVDGLDTAANAVEILSFEKREGAGRLPAALKLIEQVRSQVKGKDQPKHGV